MGDSLTTGWKMEKIPLRLARAGMVLEQPVLNAAGGVLIGEGGVLDDAKIDILIKVGVRSLCIKSGPKAGPGLAERILGRLDNLFRKEDDTFMLGMKEILRAYFERKAAEAKIGNQPDERAS